MTPLRTPHTRGGIVTTHTPPPPPLPLVIKSATSGLREMALNMQRALGPLLGDPRKKDSEEDACDDAKAQYRRSLQHLHASDGTKRNCAEVVRLMSLAADGGEQWAQFDLGRFYLWGQLVERCDRMKGLGLLELAARQGNEMARYVLYVERRQPSVFETNCGCNRRGFLMDETAVALADSSCRLYGLSEAGLFVADALWSGDGIAEDRQEALRLYRQAAEKGSPECQRTLAMRLSDGRAVPKDTKQAAHWFKLAADAGDSAAQFLYGRNILAKTDRPAAVHYLRLAARDGHLAARALLDSWRVRWAQFCIAPSCPTKAREGHPPRTYRRCGRCLTARYCDTECQRSDWLRHKVMCHRIGVGRPDAPGGGELD